MYQDEVKPILVCLLTGGDLYRIRVGAQTYLFEMHPYCGPGPLDKRTMEIRELGPKHRFWKAVSLWALQGRRTEGKEKDVHICLWQDGPLPD